MSTEQATERAKETLKSLKEWLQKMKKTTEQEFNKAAPEVRKSLDRSLGAASKAFGSTMKTIDTKTEKEQLELLKAYRRFLSGQSGYVDSRVKSLEDKVADKKSSQPTS